MPADRDPDAWDHTEPTNSWASARKVASSWRSRAGLVTGGVAGVVSLSVWWATTASEPRYSFGAHQSLGSPAIFPLLLGAALLGGLVQPKRAGLVGVMLVLPAFLVSPWTTPRGDNDGLWVLIIPTLLVLMALTVLVAMAAASVRMRRLR